MRAAADRRRDDPPDRPAVALGLRRTASRATRPTTWSCSPATPTRRSTSPRRSSSTSAPAGDSERHEQARRACATRRPASPTRPRPPRPRTTAHHDASSSIISAGAAADGLLHRHDDVHRLQGVRGRLQAVERPARRRRRVPQGRLLRQHGRAVGATTWRHVRFVELRATARTSTSDAIAEKRRPTDFGNWVFMSDVCKHCTNAGCLDACPTGALIRSEFGTVVLQPDVCNGCGYCIPACPFGVVDRDHDDGRAAKCTLCYDRLEDGLEPACAKACPTDSIQFGAYDDLVESPSGASRRCTSAASRAPTCTAPATRPRRAGRRPRRVLPAHRAARALRPAGQRRVADPGERRPRDARRGRRRAAGRRRASPPRSCGSERR